MNTPETEKKLVKLVEYKIKDTLLNLIYDLAEDPASKVEYIVPSSILEIKADIEKAYADLENILEETDRKKYEDNLNTITKSIIKCGLNLNKYISYNEQLGEKLLLAFKLNDIQNFNTSIPLNNKGVSDTIKGYVSTLSDDLEGRFAMAELISVLPFRMTRERFSDYITKAVSILTKDLPNEFANACIDRLKDMFFSDCGNDFNADFPLMHQKLEATAEAIGELDKDGITEALEDIDGNTEAIHNIYSLLSVYFNDVIYLQILSMFAVDSEFLFNNDMILKDLYYSLKDVITTKDTSLLEDIFERTENEISERFDLSKPIENELTEKIKSMTDEEYDSLSMDTKTAVNVNNTISQMFYRELDEQLMLSRGSASDVSQMTESLLTYINEKTESLTNSERKHLKQNFLKHIPCPMSKEELCDYCSYALDGINDRNLSLVTYGSIFQITDKAAEEINKQHHHSHNCSCGHDHHDHDHNCSCGHDHKSHNHN
ncbi:MAG: hypothetical protein Q4F63_01750 [Clostridia bacterium]|nr:hypothetical protein [Clostridia bacterium]